MVRSRFILIVVSLFSAFSLVACDKPQTDAPTPPPPPVQLDIMPVTSLAAQRPTLLTVDSQGRLDWLQQTTGGDDIVFSAGASEIPEATAVTTHRVLEALGAPTGAGTFHSICASDDGALYFYFEGGSGDKILACIGRLSPGNNQVEIVVDADHLMQLSDMGDAIDLARGTLIRTEHFIWLWLRNQDQSVLLAFSPLASKNRLVDLARPFHTVRSLDGELKLTGEKSMLIPGPNDTLRYIDYKTWKLWKIERSGYAGEATSLDIIPHEAAAPTVDADGNLYFLIPNDAVPRNSEGDIATTQAYPLLIVLEPNGHTRTLQRTQMTAPVTLNLQSIHPEQLCADQDEMSWLAYDPPTGLLLRMKLNRLPDRDSAN